MRDRVPTPGRENRVKITQDDGTVVDGVLEYDDQATQEGSPYTRGNVLPDDVCNAYNLDKVTSEPKDAFLAVPRIMGKALLTITVTKINGQPYPGVVVNGLANVDKPRRTTNSEGKVVVYVDAGTYSLTFAPNPVCVDTTIPGKSVTLTAGGTGSVTTQEQSNGLTSLDITSSQSVAFSANVRSVDAFCVGGGGAGSAGSELKPGAGGGGGRTATRKGFSVPAYTAISASVGAGGYSSSKDGNDGGTTLFGSYLTALGGEGALSAKQSPYVKPTGGDGGSGGAGTGYGADGGSDGGNGDPGTDGIAGAGQGTTTRAFGESGGAMFSGGGGGGGTGQGSAGSGGQGGGGAGGDSYRNGNPGSPNTGGGGGGGAQNYGSSGSGRPNNPGGDGGSGIIKLRWVNVS